MQILPEIAYAYWKGKGGNKPMVIRLTNPAQKALIFSKVSSLKGKSNSKNRPYKIEDHLPEELAEKQRREKNIFLANKKSVANKLKMSFQKGNLHIENVQYRKKVQCPRVKEMLQMDSDDICNIQELQIFGGASETEDGSTFHAFICEVSTYEDVRKAYQHFKRRYVDASHISMAYRLESIHKAYDADYFDNSEHGMGRRMLNLLTEKDLTSVAAFIVRYFGGHHIGPKCFQITQLLMEKAIQDLTEGNALTSKFVYLDPSDSASGWRRKNKPRPPRHSIRGGHTASSLWAGYPNIGLRQPTTTFNKFSMLTSSTAEDTTASDFQTQETDEFSEAPAIMENWNHPEAENAGSKHEELCTQPPLGW